jgi:hypothetical protein
MSVSHDATAEGFGEVVATVEAEFGADVGPLAGDVALRFVKEMTDLLQFFVLQYQLAYLDLRKGEFGQS